MEILGVGPLEILFVLILALVILGPKDMVKAGRTIGRFLRKVVTSPTWSAVQQTSRSLRTLPTQLIREAGLEEDIKDLEQISKDVNAMRTPFSQLNRDLEKDVGEIQGDLSAWTTPPAAKVPTGAQDSPAESQAERIEPPQAVPTEPATNAPPEES